MVQSNQLAEALADPDKKRIIVKGIWHRLLRRHRIVASETQINDCLAVITANKYIEPENVSRQMFRAVLNICQKGHLGDDK